MSLLHIIYASTSGHTEYVVGTLAAAFKEQTPKIEVEIQSAEKVTAEDCARGDLLLLGCGTWNTGGPEGQLNPHMQKLLWERAVSVDLQGKKVAILGLGDSRYRYTAKALEHLRDFVTSHGGIVIGELKIVNEPYGQEAVVQEWAKALHERLKTQDSRQS